MRTWQRVDAFAAAALIAGAALGLRAGDAGAQDKPLANLNSVLGDLRHGGFVIFFRHAATEQTGATDKAADLTRGETQRNLSAEGRAQGARIGGAVDALPSPARPTAPSPVCPSPA